MLRLSGVVCPACMHIMHDIIRRDVDRHAIMCPDWEMHVHAVALSSYVSGLEDRCGVCNCCFRKAWWRREGMYLVFVLLLLRYGVHAVCVKRDCRGVCPSSVPWIRTRSFIGDCGEGVCLLGSCCIAGLSVVIASYWRLGMVYPGHWDSARVDGELLYPVVPSPMDYFGMESKGLLEGVMGSCRHRVFGGRIGRQ